MEFKTKLKVYHRLAALASDKNDQSERQIWPDSHRGMKIARRIRLPWQFQRSGHHAGRAAHAHVHPFIRGSEACHRADFKGRGGGWDGVVGAEGGVCAAALGLRTTNNPRSVARPRTATATARSNGSVLFCPGQLSD